MLPLVCCSLITPWTDMECDLLWILWGMVRRSPVEHCLAQDTRCACLAELSVDGFDHPDESREPGQSDSRRMAVGSALASRLRLKSLERMAYVRNAS